MTTPLQKKDKLLHLYGIVGSKIADSLVGQGKLHHVKNIEKLFHAQKYQAALEELLQTRFDPLAQQVNEHTPRKSLLTRLRKWYREPWHVIRVPTFQVPNAFTRDALYYFQNPLNSKNVVYQSFLHHGHVYHFFVFKSGSTYTNIPQYVPHSVYLLGIVDNVTVEVIRLSRDEH